MGFFDKFKKDYSVYDCSNRPASWFMGAEGREAFSVYVFNCEEDCLRWWKAGYDVNLAPIAYGNMLGEIAASANKDVQEMVKAAKKQPQYPTPDIINSCAPYYFVHFFKSLKLPLPKFREGIEYEGAKLLEYDCIYLLIRSIHDNLIDARPPYNVFMCPAVMDTKLNPLLKFIVKISECERQFEEEYGSFIGYDDWKVLQAEGLKTKLALLNYVCKVANAERSDISDSSWLYDSKLYFNTGSNGGGVKPVPFVEACDIISDMVEYPDLWDGVLNDDEGRFEYIGSKRAVWEAAADSAKKSRDFAALNDAINSMGQKK